MNLAYIYLLFFRFYSHIGHYTLLNRVPVLYSSFLLVIYFVYSHVYMSVPSPNLSPSPALSPLITINLFSKSVTLFLFVYRLICIIFYFLDSTYKSYHTVFFFLCLTYFIIHFPPSPSTLLQMPIFCSFLWLGSIPLCVSVYILFLIYIQEWNRWVIW